MLATLLEGAAAPIAMHIEAAATFAPTRVDMNQMMHEGHEGWSPTAG